VTLHLPAGGLLLAQPAMQDPWFEATVVLLCRHDDQGAFGLVLNRPLEVPVATVLPEGGGLTALDEPLFWGGPVGHRRVHLLHDGPPRPGSQELVPGLCFGGDAETARAVLAEGGRLRFFLGYAGWDGGQLDEELAAGGWLVLPPDPREAWDDGWDSQWERLVPRADRRWAARPARPDLN